VPRSCGIRSSLSRRYGSCVVRARTQFRPASLRRNKVLSLAMIEHHASTPVRIRSERHQIKDLNRCGASIRGKRRSGGWAAAPSGASKRETRFEGHLALKTGHSEGSLFSARGPRCRSKDSAPARPDRRIFLSCVRKFQRCRTRSQQLSCHCQVCSRTEHQRRRMTVAVHHNYFRPGFSGPHAGREYLPSPAALAD